MSDIAREAREELLETVAHAAEEIGAALALVEAAYELLDEGSADRLEEQLFRPIQGRSTGAPGARTPASPSATDWRRARSRRASRATPRPSPAS